jgi:hAT family C-terminal dimerisation region
MSSSVSSECAFSQGGITVSKHRSSLKGDIVEALQCIKCAIRHDLLFREEAPSSVLEERLEEGEDKGDREDERDANHSDDEKGWDELLIEEEDDDDSIDVDSDSA